MNLKDQYLKIRTVTEKICEPLMIEDYVPQPTDDVSPPKWHLGHTTWFFETFLLKIYDGAYTEFHTDFSYLFNSYYETEGKRVLRHERGNLSRPGVKEIYAYRHYVDEKMLAFLSKTKLTPAQEERLVLGLNHEEQHQELLLTDIKYILGANPLHPKYNDIALCESSPADSARWISIEAGTHSIGYAQKGFCFDNEKDTHKIYTEAFSISSSLITNGEYLEFIENKCYQDFTFWHSEAWAWLKNNNINSPLYWLKKNNAWFYYTLAGLKKIDLSSPVTHISFYEAYAFAQWKNLRLPTEFEWEIASDRFTWGQRWEWTESAYLPYPRFKKAAGAIGEYNGKFMVNQKVLRGASVATSANHSRSTYRNFFHPHLRWQYTGIRLAKWDE